MKQKNIVILGSTGSIGCNSLEVIRNHSDRFKAFALTAYNNYPVLLKQIVEFKPKFVAVSEKIHSKVASFIKKENLKTRILSVENDLTELVAQTTVHTVVIGMRGSSALIPFMKALENGKVVAPANKEALVIAGHLLQKQAIIGGGRIIPIDSEQSALFQCLNGENKKDVKKVLLTASGGALLNTPKKDFKSLTVDHILKHPRWKMGAKITVDSALLMNKGFEVLEAMSLFDFSIDQIEVIVHPEAIIHSMLEMTDGSVLAQLSVTDMKLPIQYALTYPNRLDSHQPSLDFFKLKQLNFQKPDLKRFPSLDLCYEVGKRGGTFPAVLNAADEEVVDHFLKGKLQFHKIYSIVEQVVLKHRSKSTKPTLTNILAADQWAREQAQLLLN